MADAESIKGRLTEERIPKALWPRIGKVNTPPPKGGGFGLRLKSAISAKADVSLLRQA